ncbi:MAG: beta-lactamase family protein [Calditrichaeota bacterium]|nr:beta-lactamase family protein [Calditrichota bacterium]
MKYLIIYILIYHLALQQSVSDQLDSYMQAQTDYRLFSGVVLVAKDNQIILKKAYGMANDSLSIANTVHTKFRLASLTKSFTALLLFKLQKRGLLSINDPLSGYIPDYPRGNEITLNQILHHTSGIPDLLQYQGFWQSLDHYVSAEEALRLFKDKPLDFEPGSRWQYSNSGYIVLGYIIEKLTGKSYFAALKHYVLDPLEMADTGFESDSLIEEIGASGYQEQDGQRQRMAYVQMSINHAAGALYSTVDDMYKWDRAFYPGAFLSAAEIDTLLTPGLNAYGWGWGILPMHNRFQTKQVFMNGRFSGFAANISRYPQRNACVIVLSNLMTINPQLIADNLAAILFGQDVIAPMERKAVALDATQLKIFEGNYQFPEMNGLQIQVFFENGFLYRRISGQPDMKLVPRSANSFFYEDRDVDLSFSKTDGAYEMILNLNGQRFSGKRS